MIVILAVTAAAIIWCIALVLHQHCLKMRARLNGIEGGFSHLRSRVHLMHDEMDNLQYQTMRLNADLLQSIKDGMNKPSQERFNAMPRRKRLSASWEHLPCVTADITPPMSHGWAAGLNDAGDPCVWPLNDLRPHDLEGDCWCRPFLDELVTVHNSADGREAFERGERKPS